MRLPQIQVINYKYHLMVTKIVKLINTVIP